VRLVKSFAQVFGVSGMRMIGENFLNELLDLLVYTGPLADANGDRLELSIESAKCWFFIAIIIILVLIMITLLLLLTVLFFTVHVSAEAHLNLWRRQVGTNSHERAIQQGTDVHH
jgi:hypothetical protein